MAIETAIILAGGEGTRLRPITNEIPKPMVELFNKPLLYYILRLLEKHGIKKVILAIGYKSGKITEYFDQIKNDFSFELIYSIEDKPLGTGGAIKKALLSCKNETVIILNGDSIFVTDFEKMYKIHKLNNATVTMGLYFVDDISNSGSVKLDNDLITDFIEKPNTKISGLINAGIYLLDKKILQKLPSDEKFSFERDFLEKECKNRTLFGYTIKEFYTVNNIEEYNYIIKKLNDRRII
ncbi:MAG: sugar phosphate nucleotidyltransferase [Candidatus Micrarchaeaceae archaeon]